MGSVCGRGGGGGDCYRRCSRHHVCSEEIFHSRRDAVTAVVDVPVKYRGGSWVWLNRYDLLLRIAVKRRRTTPTFIVQEDVHCHARALSFAILVQPVPVDAKVSTRMILGEPKVGVDRGTLLVSSWEQMLNPGMDRFCPLVANQYQSVVFNADALNVFVGLVGFHIRNQLSALLGGQKTLYKNQRLPIDLVLLKP